MFSRVLVAAALLFGVGSVAEAGVAGHSFAGTLTNRAGEAANLCMEFDADSREWTLQRQFRADSKPKSFEGSFMQTDLILFSFFNGTLGNRTVSGFEILGFVILNVNGPGGGLAAQGTAFFNDCDPTPVLPAPAGDSPRVTRALQLPARVAAREQRTAIDAR